MWGVRANAYRSAAGKFGCIPSFITMARPNASMPMNVSSAASRADTRKRGSLTTPRGPRIVGPSGFLVAEPEGGAEPEKDEENGVFGTVFGGLAKRSTLPAVYVPMSGDSESKTANCDILSASGPKKREGWNGLLFGEVRLDGMYPEEDVRWMAGKMR